MLQRVAVAVAQQRVEAELAEPPLVRLMERAGHLEEEGREVLLLVMTVVRVLILEMEVRRQEVIMEVVVEEEHHLVVEVLIRVVSVNLGSVGVRVLLVSRVLFVM